MPKRNSSVALTNVHEWQDGQVNRVQDYLVGEEPLEMRIGNVPLSVTMRTAGHDFELAAGFLFTENLISKREEIATIGYGEGPDGKQSPNIVNIGLADGVEFDCARLQRNFFAASSCGICGKASIESIRVRGIRRPNENLRLDPDMLCSFPDQLRSTQAIFGRTGGLHAAGIFTTSGELLVMREDVGRHNAVDKVIGWALREGRLPLSDHVMMVSGRGGFEIIQKALVAGLPVVASVSAPSSLAVQLAREFDLTLIGFLRGRRFVIYSGQNRLQTSIHLARVEA